MEKRACFGCKGLFPEEEGPTHDYIGASSGCWKVYGEILAKEFSEYSYPAVHRLTVDTYCAQHPGKESPQSIRSVGIHLIALYIGLEMRVPLPRITAMMDRLLKKGSPFRWLKPPEDLGGISVADISNATSFQEHERLVCAWAKEVWKAWEIHHRTIQVWYEELAVPRVTDVWL